MEVIVEWDERGDDGDPAETASEQGDNRGAVPADIEGYQGNILIFHGFRPLGAHLFPPFPVDGKNIICSMP